MSFDFTYLTNQFEGITVKEHESMAAHTSFRCGGTVRALITVSKVEELKAVLQEVTAREIPHLMLGNGTNVLFRDGEYEGVVIKFDPESTFFDYTSTDVDGKHFPFEFEVGEEVKVTVGASMLLSTFSRMIIGEPEVATGMEALSGIPGSVGGAAFMNAGAYGSEMKDVVLSVHAVSGDGKDERDFSNEEMDFSYRHSVLMENGYIVTSVTFLLHKGIREEIVAKMNECTLKRVSKQPLKYPSAGSTFKRPEGYFAGKLIEDAGLKGLTVGGAQVSTLHSGFVINTGGATATDVLQLIALVQNTVYDKFGVMLEPEVRII